MRLLNQKGEREEYARVLDYMPHGHPDDTRPLYQKKPLIQAVGERKLILVEIAPKEGKTAKPYDRVYIGEGERDIADYVKRRLRYDELTHNAQIELPDVLKEIVMENKDLFLEIYNESYPITTRLHMLELLPGVGKKTMWQILDERKREPFKNFEDISNRVKGFYHPENAIVKRMEEELQDEHIKYRLFAVK